MGHEEIATVGLSSVVAPSATFSPVLVSHTLQFQQHVNVISGQHQEQTCSRYTKESTCGFPPHNSFVPRGKGKQQEYKYTMLVFVLNHPFHRLFHILCSCTPFNSRMPPRTATFIGNVDKRTPNVNSSTVPTRCNCDVAVDTLKIHKKGDTAKNRQENIEATKKSFTSSSCGFSSPRPPFSNLTFSFYVSVPYHFERLR